MKNNKYLFRNKDVFILLYCYNERGFRNYEINILLKGEKILLIREHYLVLKKVYNETWTLLNTNRFYQMDFMIDSRYDLFLNEFMLRP